MKLQKLDINGLSNIYALDVVKKEFEKSVDEKWKNEPPMKRYQEKLLANLAVLDIEKERAIELPQYEKLVGEENLYSIRHPKTGKNVRVLYTIIEGSIIILLVVFLEKNDSDYRKALNVAKNRLRKLEEE